MKPEAEPHIGILIKHINNHILTEINNTLKPYNITSVQLSVLFYINNCTDKEHIFQKDIQQHLKLAHPTVTGIVQRLEEKDMIKRYTCADDCRYKCHVITDKGKDVINHVHKFAENTMEKRILDGFSKDEADTVRSLLTRILENLEN